MTDTTMSLRRKIKGAQDLQSVVRTMKAIAATSIGQYEKSVDALTEYIQAIELGLSVCLRNIRLNVEMICREKQKSDIGLIVFGSDQGLVGQFNDLVADQAVKLQVLKSERVHVWAVGERVHARIKDSGLPLEGLFSVPKSIKAIVPLIGKILIESGMFHDPNGLSELYLIYNRHSSSTGYAPVSQRLLPLDEHWRIELSKLPWPTNKYPEVMGSETISIRALIREYLFISLFRACSESLASENASRLIAMQRADKNIDELLEHLNTDFHRVRQNRIDEELFDVISGFEALSGIKN